MKENEKKTISRETLYKTTPTLKITDTCKWEKNDYKQNVEKQNMASRMVGHFLEEKILNVPGKQSLGYMFPCSIFFGQKLLTGNFSRLLGPWGYVDNSAARNQPDERPLQISWE